MQTTRSSKSPLPPCASRPNSPTLDAADSALGEQVGGGCRPPSPCLELDALVLDGPSVLTGLQTLPVTRVIPPTPISGDNVFSTALSSGAANVESLTPTSGRRTTVVNAVLTAGYEELEATLTRLVEQTSLTTQQILDGWHKSRSRTVSGIDHWNQYTKYAMRHEEQQRRRLGLLQNVLLTPTIRRQLYSKFKEDNPDTWQEILEVHDMVDGAQYSPQTATQRAQIFHKAKKRIISVLESESAKHGFEAAIVMCGSVVNEDASLGFTHTTGGATTFFETRCRANPGTIIGHLKSHVYNHVSLESVNEAFGNEGNQSRQNQDRLLAPAALPVLNGIEELMNDSMAQIKDSMMTLLQSAGGDVSKFKRSTFPWTTLLAFLAAQGLVMKGWPDGVLMPGQPCHAGARTKGIADLSHAERRRLQQALLAGEISIARLSSRDEQRAVSTFEAPVIIGAPPPSDSDNTQALQMYGDGTLDADGPERLPPTAAATRIKPKRVPKATTEDPIIISSGSDDGAPRIISAKRKFDSVVQKGKKAIILEFSSDDEVSIAGEARLPIDSKETPENGYHDAVDSRKRKAKKPPPTSRVNKKIRALDYILSKKGKERERPTKGGKKVQGARWVDVSDSDTEAPTKTAKAQPAVASQMRPGENEDAFNDETVPGTATRSFLPSTPKDPMNIGRSVEPSSPSPKRHASFEPPTKLGTPRKCLDELVAPVADGEAAVTAPLIPTAPLAEVDSSTVRPITDVPANNSQPTSPHPNIVPRPPVPVTQTASVDTPTTARAEMTTTTLPLTNPTGSSQTVTTPLPSQIHQTLRDERLPLTCGDWTERGRQIGGGYPPYVFHAPVTQQPSCFPYYGNDSGMLVLQGGAMSARRAMYLDPTGASGYQGDTHGGGGDPRGPHGGFYPRAGGPAAYPGAGDLFLGPSSGLRLSPHPLPGPSRQSSLALSDTQQGRHQTYGSPYPNS